MAVPRMPDALSGIEICPAGQPHPKAAPVRINGADLWTDPSGALWWPQHGLLAVADLHLEKGSCYATRGRLLPPYDTAATLARLIEVIRRTRPQTVVCLGDSFHDVDGPDRLPPRDADRLGALVADTRWVWIAGNHDPALSPKLGGEVRSDVAVGPLTFRHMPTVGAPGEVAGHLHPKLRVALRTRTLSGRCFVSDGKQMILPAFGAFAGGLDAGDAAIRRIVAGSATAHLLLRNRVVPVPLKRQRIKR